MTRKEIVCWLQLFLIITIGSCTNSYDNVKNELSKYPAALVRSDETLKFKIDDSTSYESNNYKVIDFRHEEVLAFESKHKNSIQFYSLANREKIKEISFNKEGLHAIHEIHGFAMISEDSILVFDKWNSRAFLIDSEGEVKEEISLYSKKYLNHASMNRSPDIIIDNKLCMFVFPNVKINDPNLFGGNVKFEHVYDLETKSYGYLDFSWPEIYNGKNWTFYHTFPSRVKGADESLVYSFGADPNLYVVSLDGKYSIHNAKSDFFDQIESLNVGEDDNAAFLRNGVYGMIAYDKYRNVYYRFTGIETPLTTPDGTMKHPDQKLYSIIILDNEFKKIGETLLEPFENYLIKDWFVTKKGLCISMANRFNPNLNEDYMEFNVLELKYNNEE